MAFQTIRSDLVALVELQGLFDAEYYLQQAPDCAGRSVRDLIRHYLETGWTQGLNPHRLFSTKYYLNRFPDVSHARLNPLIHYLQYGAGEGRNPHPLFDHRFYQDHYLKGSRSGLSSFVHYVRIGSLSGARPNEFFIPEYYRARLGQRSPRTGNLIEHYVRAGWPDGIATSPLFHTAYYLRTYPDVRAAGVNPLEHYIQYGRAEGRSGSALDNKIRHTQDVTYAEWAEIERFLLPARPHPAPGGAPVDLAVIVSVHNTAPASVAACFDSLLCQSDHDWRLVVFDDCVTSGAVRKVIDDYRGRDAAIQIVSRSSQSHDWRECLPGHPGLTAEYWLHLDCAEVLAGDAIARIRSAVASNPSDGLLVLPPLPGRPLPEPDWQGTIVAHHRLVEMAVPPHGQPAPSPAFLPSDVEAPLSYREYLRLTRQVGGGKVEWPSAELRPSGSHGGKSVDVYVHSAGNLFFRPSAEAIASAFQELGWRSTVCDEREYLAREATLNLIVGPHEFLVLMKEQTGVEPFIPANTILFNTEQPWTHWFHRARHYFPRALKIWDMDYSSYQRLASLGYDCDYLPLGSLEFQSAPREIPVLPACALSDILAEPARRFSCHAQPWDCRPIDILFIGGLSSKRCDFFARNAVFFNRRECYLHFFDNTEPLLMGKNTEMGPDMSSGLIQRSKILLNIHRGDEPYFEWQRIVVQGMANGALMLTEPCTPAPPFRDGVDFLTAELGDFPDVLDSLLGTPAGMDRARSVSASGMRRYYEGCKLRNRLAALLNKLS